MVSLYIYYFIWLITAHNQVEHFKLMQAFASFHNISKDCNSLHFLVFLAIVKVTIVHASLPLDHEKFLLGHANFFGKHAGCSKFFV